MSKVVSLTSKFVNLLSLSPMSTPLPQPNPYWLIKWVLIWFLTCPTPGPERRQTQDHRGEDITDRFRLLILKFNKFNVSYSGLKLHSSTRLARGVKIAKKIKIFVQKMQSKMCVFNHKATPVVYEWPDKTLCPIYTSGIVLYFLSVPLFRATYVSQYLHSTDENIDWLLPQRLVKISCHYN